MDEVKITTGEGAGPSGQQFSQPPVPPEITQPEFLGTENLGPSPIPPGVENQGGVLKTIFWILLGLIIAGGVGALAYFVIYPLAFPPQAPVHQPPVTTAPPAATHTSFLVVPPAAVSEVKLADTNYLTIANALQNEAFNQLADGQFKELKISGSKGQIPFSSFLSGFPPDFEDDFTALLYYDANGVWPIYVAKLKNGIAADTVRASVRPVEGALDLANFYLAPPGAFSVFKDGKVGTYLTRYSVGAQPGVAFNYGVFGKYLIISTNYNGLKGVLPLLGL